MSTPDTNPIPSQPPPPRPPFRLGRWIFWTLALALGVAAGGYLAGWLRLSPQHDPRAPLDVAAAPNWLTPYKLRRTRADPALCLDALQGAGLRFTPVPDRPLAGGCGLANAVRLVAGRELALTRATVLSCPAVLAFALWERHGLQPAAREHLGQPVTRLEHMGSFACRDINTGDGRATGRRSRHATADALDIGAFVLEDGRRISVLRDSPEPWASDAGSPAEASGSERFLRAAHASACRSFDGTLGPGYNRAHRDHFHLEVGGWKMCR